MNNEDNLVSAVTDWSCVPACLESIAKDNGLEISQNHMLKEFSSNFPKWEEMPGIIEENPNSLGEETLRLAQLIELASGVDYCPDKDSIITRFSETDTVGFILFARKFWNEKRELVDSNHAMRIVNANKKMFRCMNPQKDDKALAGDVPWSRLKCWQAEVISLKK